MSEVNLKDLVISLETGKRPKGGAISAGIPSLGGEHINVDGGFNLNEDKLKYVALEYFNDMTKGKIKEKDILVVKDGATTGKVAYVDDSFPLEQACINEHVFLIRVNEAVLPKYLFYYFYSPVGQRSILKDFRGATVGGISTGFIDMNIYLPSKNIQERTVKILDIAKQAIDKRKEQIETCDELIKSQFIEMFGDPFLNPKGYKTVRLGDLAVKVTDGVHAKPEYTTEGRPFISVVNITKRFVDFTNCKYVSEEAYQKMIKSTYPERGDILYTKVGATYGIPAYIDTDVEFCLYVSVCLIKPKHKLINSKFLALSMDMPYVKMQADRRIKGIGVPDLHLNQIREFMILCPPREKQEKFIQFVQQVDKLKFEMEQSLVELENNFNSLMQRAFKGELF